MMPEWNHSEVGTPLWMLGRVSQCPTLVRKGEPGTEGLHGELDAVQRAYFMSPLGRDNASASSAKATQPPGMAIGLRGFIGAAGARTSTTAQATSRRTASVSSCFTADPETRSSEPPQAARDDLSAAFQIQPALLIPEARHPVAPRSTSSAHTALLSRASAGRHVEKHMSRNLIASVRSHGDLPEELLRMPRLASDQVELGQPDARRVR